MFKEHDFVELTANFKSLEAEPRFYAKGDRGTVVAVYAGGDSYAVEFRGGVVVTVPAGYLRLVETPPYLKDLENSKTFDLIECYKKEKPVVLATILSDNTSIGVREDHLKLLLDNAYLLGSLDSIELAREAIGLGRKP